ncbi:hypothetical protein DY000_02062625 [Brassica cretica]|uniref:Uncharacterized protein n=1 Tax=Brassica cretica TaxID=69181 RepID=A0ABQ7AYX5_BRACR|nr:hypothetical protein DY000_02062625 [Brassica cretica]
MKHQSRFICESTAAWRLEAMEKEGLQWLGEHGRRALPNLSPLICYSAELLAAENELLAAEGTSVMKGAV